MSIEVNMLSIQSTVPLLGSHGVFKQVFDLLSKTCHFGIQIHYFLCMFLEAKRLIER